MLQEKQGVRVRISSHENVINMSEDCFPSDSKCSCPQCDSIVCFKIRNVNSGIPCTCTDCNPNICLTWDVKNEATESTNETKKRKVAPEMSKDLLNISGLKLKPSGTKKCTTSSINSTNQIIKENISCSYTGNDVQNNNFDDPELKEVFTKDKKSIGKCDTMKQLTENKKFNDPEIKETSSNEESDIIECDVIQLEKDHSNDPETIQVSAKDGPGTKKCCSKNQTSEIKNCCDYVNKQCITSRDLKNKHSSKLDMPLRKNESSHPETKELFTRNIRKCCSLKTQNTKSDLPEFYQIFTNEKKNVIKCCNIGKKNGNKFADAENKQDNPENRCEDLPNSKTGREPALEINTTKKITNIKCNLEHPMKDKISDIDFGNYTRYSYKEVSHTKNKINADKNNKSYEKYVSRLQSVAISYARQDYENSRAELSAQIMNVPYKEFKDSLSRRQSSTQSNTCNSSIKLEKMDIFSRLKEIYKACSCKVCECIAGKSLFNHSEICKCEPCDCNDCNGYMARLQNRLNNDPPHSGCACVRCDRKDCRGVVKSTRDYSACDCKPCDCVRCSESISKPCSCTPCQCETCKTSIIIPQRLMVANVAGSFRHSNCDCEPCECTNCTSGYSAMTSNLIREVSTGMISYGNCNCEACFNDTCQLGRPNCRCESQHKAIRKPRSEKRSDYGIHRVNIKENKYEKKTILNNNRNTITMFALSNNYPYSLFNNTNKKMSCECDVCECIVCKDKGKGNITNKPVSNKIDKQNCHLNSKSLNDCACSPPKSYIDVNVDGCFCEETGYDSCNCINSNHLGYNSEVIEEKFNNFKKAKPTYSTFEDNKMSKLRECPECKNLVEMQSEDSTLTDDALSHDNEIFYHLKKGKLLTLSMLENNGLTSDSSYIHNPEKDALRENDLLRKSFRRKQNSKLCRSKYRHNYFHNDDNPYKTPKSAVEDIPTNSSFTNMVFKEVPTSTEIYKTNSVDFKDCNVSEILYSHSKTNAQNDDSNAILLDDGLTLVAEKQSHFIDNKLEYNKDMNRSSQTPLLDRQEVNDFFNKTMSLSNTEVHFSSAKSMSLVKMLCQERNLNIDNRRAKKFLQSLEKNPLKRLKMDEENVAYTCDNTLDDNIFLDSIAKHNYSFPIDKNLLINMDHEKSVTLNYENQKVATYLTDTKIDNCDIQDNNIVNPPVLKTTKQIKSKTFLMVEKKPNNYNKNVRVKGNAAQFKTNKGQSKAKVINSNLKSKTDNNLKGNINKVNNKRCLEIPNIIDTATSVINFSESDRHIDFDKSLKLLNEVNYGMDENKKPSPILRKNFYFRPENLKNTGKCPVPLIEVDVKNAVKSTSLQTITIYPYCPEIGYGNKALSKLNLELKSYMSDATSQTKRINIVVDKEINCDIYQSRENLRQSIQSFINMTLKNVVQRTDIETRKKNFIRCFKVSKINIAKSSCNGLKASFVVLRKVSDHTVLLKWTMPRDLGNIQGYELQVDGRPVQKILNPSRCMAVLTCLPHSERLLLTIRTMTNLDTCHNPVTTVVYNPNKNKPGPL